MRKCTKIKRLAHIGAGGQKGWIYSVDGFIGALPASQYKDPAKIVVIKKDKDK